MTLSHDSDGLFTTSMETTSDTQASKVVEIAPGGDLILLAGPEETRLLVCSVALIAVSKPFSAMLGPDWKEGHDMHDHGKPSELHLPEDNAAALKIMCSVIHHKNSEVPRNLAVDDVLAVAVAADKYDCGDALRFASESWLQTSGKSAGDLMLLTAAAYLFQNAQAFKEITRALILDYDGPYLALCWEEAESLMTWRVFCLLEQQRGFARLELADILMAGVNDGTVACWKKRDFGLHVYFTPPSPRHWSQQKGCLTQSLRNQAPRVLTSASTLLQPTGETAVGELTHSSTVSDFVYAAFAQAA
ncbi:hypothetical protein CCUS01_11263 [Colletotrichum cuscutae]|uniref:BTB domain-containing protein n=1 Tax=Colletotrichum cuscutae TaxID=1209917 RepID=A0AAI9U688_9PEZI|nr:hypothetical protein CCUS01_11263 [Colletotrichum cuscutae]